MYYLFGAVQIISDKRYDLSSKSKKLQKFK